jgi:hypothetical protein
VFPLFHLADGLRRALGNGGGWSATTSPCSVCGRWRGRCSPLAAFAGSRRGGRLATLMGTRGVTIGALVALAAIGIVPPVASSEPLTREAYVDQADDLCKAGQKRTGPILRRAYSNEARGRLSTAGKQSLRAFRIARHFLPRLRRLEPPEADQAAVDRWLDGGEHALALFIRSARQLRREHVRRSDRLYNRAANVADRANAAVEGFGFEVCL